MENKSEAVQTDRETIDTSNFLGGDAVGSGGAKGVGNETSTEANETSRDGWTSIFPKEDREKFGEALKRFAKPKDLLAEYGRLAEREKNSVIMPGENATEDEIKAYRKALGVPDEAKGYDLPEIGANKAFDEWYRTTAHTANLTKSQAKKFYELYLQEDRRQLDEAKAMRAKRAEANTEALKKEWGEKADENYELAKRAFKEYGDDDLATLMKENGLESDPRLIKVFYGIARATMGDRGTEGTLYHDKEQSPGLHYNV